MRSRLTPLRMLFMVSSRSPRPIERCLRSPDDDPVGIGGGGGINNPWEDVPGASGPMFLGVILC